MCLHLKSVATQTRFEKPRRHDQCAHNDELTLLSKANTIQQSYVNSAFTPATSVQVKSQIKGVQHGRLYQHQQARHILALIHIGQRCTKSNERHDQRRAPATQMSRQTQRRPKANPMSSLAFYLVSCPEAADSLRTLHLCGSLRCGILCRRTLLHDVCIATMILILHDFELNSFYKKGLSPKLPFESSNFYISCH